MIDEIINKYEKFPDGSISEFSYKFDYNNLKREINLIVHCMDFQNNCEWNVIKLIFMDVIHFQFVEIENSCSTEINSALLKKENGVITVDFFPLIYFEELKENDKSDFMIKCKELKYELISKYTV
ncbi:MAG: hypothetical protein U0264_04475 [Candidatus Kapaibacterium sp.]